MTAILTANQIRSRIRILRQEIADLEEQLISTEMPTDIPTLRCYLERHPTVQQTHFDPHYGTRVLQFMGVCPMTGVFQFRTENWRGFTGLSFGVARNSSFGEDGFTVTYQNGMVRYKYLKKAPACTSD